MPTSAESRFRRLPSALQRQSKRAVLAGDIPALLAHPDWERPAPVVIWLHGRTVNKELDPGRYLRWIRSGIAACAIDLPGHGERFDEASQSEQRTLYVVEQGVSEIDRVLEALADPKWQGAFDLDRVALGGMSAGGMITLRRLCDDHPFVCASVESTAGSFDAMPYMQRYPEELIHRLDPIRHLAGWRPVPLLALHSEADEWVPVAATRVFIEALRRRYETLDADPDLARMQTWPTTGAPFEHAGFGRVANDAKNLQLAFFMEHLKPR